jgi:hypothetical protein
MQTYNFPDHMRGDTYDGLIFEVIAYGSPKNLTNTAIKIDFRQGSKTGPIGKSLTVGDGITKTDALSGKFKIDEFKVLMAPGIYYYDVQFTDGDVVKTYQEGQWKILQDATK